MMPHTAHIETLDEDFKLTELVDVDWTPDPNDADEVTDTKAVVERCCSLFERHLFLMGILTSAGFRPCSIELLATHPVWIAKVAQGSVRLAEDVRADMRDLRSLFRSHGVRLDRESPSVGIRRAEVTLSWLSNEGVPGKVIWNPDGTRSEILYDIPEPFVIEDLPSENVDEHELALAR